MTWTRRGLWHVLRGARGVHRLGLVVRDANTYCGHHWDGRTVVVGMHSAIEVRDAFDLTAANRARRADLSDIHALWRKAGRP